MKPFIWQPATIAATMFLAIPAAAQGSAQPIVFTRGKTQTTVVGTIKGDADRDYLVSAKAGQTLSVSLVTSNSSAYFNILPPGSDEAIFIGSISGADFSGPLPKTGDYRIRVYLMRSAARRKEGASFTLKIGLTGGRPDR